MLVCEIDYCNPGESASLGVAELALFLASSKAKQITGGVFVVDGGITAGRPRFS
jgi:enoyl-[acyl-carrier-protein] reductase (NADH)